METKKEKEKEKDYTITNENIKFPVFIDKSLIPNFKKEKITKETLFQDINKIIEILDAILNQIFEMIQKNLNNFKALCDEYNLNSFDFFIIFRLIKEFVLLLKLKLEQKDEKEFKLISFDDFFKNAQYKDIINNQYKITDTKYETVKSKIDNYVNLMKEVLESKHECGIKFMSYVLKYYYSVLIKAQNQINAFIKIKFVSQNDNSKQYHKNMINYFDLIAIFKVFETSNILFSNSFFVDKDDLYNYEEDSEEWAKMKKIVYRIHAKNKDEIEKLNIEGQQKLEKMTIFFNKAINFDSYFITNVFKSAGYYLKFKFNSDENLMEFESKQSMLLNPNKIIFLDFMKLGDIKMFKTIREKSYPKITVREKIYMKKEYPEISLDYIKQLLIKIYGKEIIEKNFGNTKQKERIILDKTLIKNFPKWSQKVPKEYKPYYVSSRLLNSFNFKNFGMKNYQSSFFGLFQTKIEKKEAEKVRGIIIFLHGGGFMKMKNFFHENYLRDIVNQVNIPLIGFDYAAAPEHPYPEGLNDCFQGYMWILENCEKELGFKPEKIILAGDSSGGNFILALTFLLISMNIYENKNIRLPDLLIPLYPACHTGIKNMSLSLASSFEDHMLNIKSLLFINKVYRDYYPNDLDPFLNPSEVTEEILKHLPKTTIISATNDPLRDDTIRFMRKISKIPDLDVKDYELENYQHGFMGPDDLNISGLPRKLFSKIINEFLGK
jgi:acetyl esterase/lipase